MTIAPTIETAEPIALGSRIPASRKISNEISMIMASTTAGNGTISRCAAITIKSRRDHFLVKSRRTDIDGRRNQRNKEDQYA